MFYFIYLHEFTYQPIPETKCTKQYLILIISYFNGFKWVDIQFYTMHCNTNYIFSMKKKVFLQSSSIIEGNSYCYHNVHDLTSHSFDLNFTFTSGLPPVFLALYSPFIFICFYSPVLTAVIKICIFVKYG